MPNWCMNSLSITGPKNVIDEIAATKLSLDNIVPTPPELQEMEKMTPVPKNQVKLRAALEARYGCSTAYDWHVTQWGTKWDVGPMDVDVSQNYLDSKKFDIYASFDSAWGPPVKAMEFLYNKYKDSGLTLRLEYIETGCQFTGVATGENGTFLDESFDYSNSKQLFNIADELDSDLARGEAESLQDYEESDVIESDDPPKIVPEVKLNKKYAKTKVVTKKVAAKKKVAKKKVSKKKSSAKKSLTV